VRDEALMARAAAPAPAPTSNSGMGRFVALVGLTVLLVVAVVLLLEFAGRTVSFWVPTQPTLALPHPTATTDLEMQVVMSGAGFDATVRAGLLWLADRAVWVALVVMVVGIVLRLTIAPGSGVTLLWTGGIGVVVFLLLPVVVQLLVGVIEYRNGNVAVGLPHLPAGR
jgi:hypothetical protein